MIQSLGAKLVESLEEASTVTRECARVLIAPMSYEARSNCYYLVLFTTDVIATDGKSKLRRTPKLMICLCKTSNILSLDWLGKHVGALNIPFSLKHRLKSKYHRQQNNRQRKKRS